MTDNCEVALESVLTALTRSNGQPDVLINMLHEIWPQARATALIGGLLSAEKALRDVFMDTTEPGQEGHLALAAALTLAEAANEVELMKCGPFVRLSDLVA